MSPFAEIGMSVGKEKVTVAGCIIARPDSVFFRVILMT